MRAVLAKSLNREDSFEALGEDPLALPALEKVIDLLNESRVELERVLLFTDVDWHAIHAKTVPELTRLIALEFRLEEVSKHGLQLMEQAGHKRRPVN